MPKATNNRFLACLSIEARDQILSHAVALPAPQRMPLYTSEQEPGFAHFITSGLASIVAVTQNGSIAEVGVIGMEGFTASLHLIAPAVVSTTSFMQLEGTVLKVPYAELQRLFRSSEEIRYRTLEFVQEQSLIVCHIAACNVLHDVGTRLVRWLLMARDRTGLQVLNVTQETLGMMLGVRRTTISQAAAVLQRREILQYTRGRVAIIDGPRLEGLACDCYHVTKRLHVNLYHSNLV